MVVNTHLEDFGSERVLLQIDVQWIDIDIHQVLQQVKVDVLLFLQRRQSWSTFTQRITALTLS